MAKPKPRVVRRQDSLGRSYFIHPETGRRVSRRAWEVDLKRRKNEGARVPKPPKKHKSGGGGVDIGHAPESPFPPGVTPEGIPEYEDGEIPYHEVDDEADYEEGSGA